MGTANESTIPGNSDLDQFRLALRAIPSRRDYDPIAHAEDFRALGVCQTGREVPVRTLYDFSRNIQWTSEAPPYSGAIGGTVT